MIKSTVYIKYLASVRGWTSDALILLWPSMFTEISLIHCHRYLSYSLTIIIEINIFDLFDKIVSKHIDEKT